MSRTDAPQGVIARAAQISETSLEDLMKLSEPAPFLLAVDGVTDPLGALLRIADCAGVTGVILPRHRAVHITPTVTKAAAGAVEYLPMALVGGLATAIDSLKKADVWTVGSGYGRKRIDPRSEGRHRGRLPGVGIRGQGPVEAGSRTMRLHCLHSDSRSSRLAETSRPHGCCCGL